MLPAWRGDASLEEISAIWTKAGYRAIAEIDNRLPDKTGPATDTFMDMLRKSALYNYEVEPDKSYEVLARLRSFVEQDEQVARSVLGV
jgi:hypothetical protein